MATTKFAFNVEPVIIALGDEKRPAMFIAPMLENKPMCKVELLIVATKPALLVTPKVSRFPAPGKLKEPAVKIPFTAKLQETATDDIMLKDPWICIELKKLAGPIVDNAPCRYAKFATDSVPPTCKEDARAKLLFP